MSKLPNDEDTSRLSSPTARQLTTFSLGNNIYGIDVMRVQEVTNTLPVTRIPIAPDYVCGLINLRGQIATAIGLHQLFGIGSEGSGDSKMTVICKFDGALMSLFVDSIGDVIEISESDCEPVPDTIKGPVRKFMSGVYKTKGQILSIVDLDKLASTLNQNLEKQS